ncbi:hypothetical protein Taro_044777 [Colocasia esculenta]|uniref:Uncharacterized protein n=1 Tax=Colocasia esculenta TaxID=4460 RepID=A0A843WPJ8_COLES|nr:hypothetical protein [Colocasia esculenta]
MSSQVLIDRSQALGPSCTQELPLFEHSMGATHADSIESVCSSTACNNDDVIDSGASRPTLDDRAQKLPLFALLYPYLEMLAASTSSPLLFALGQRRRHLINCVSSSSNNQKVDLITYPHSNRVSLAPVNKMEKVKRKKTKLLQQGGRPYIGEGFPGVGLRLATPWNPEQRISGGFLASAKESSIGYFDPFRGIGKTREVDKYHWIGWRGLLPTMAGRGRRSAQFRRYEQNRKLKNFVKRLKPSVRAKLLELDSRTLEEILGVATKQESRVGPLQGQDKKKEKLVENPKSTVTSISEKPECIQCGKRHGGSACWRKEGRRQRRWPPTTGWRQSPWTLTQVGVHLAGRLHEFKRLTLELEEPLQGAATPTTRIYISFPLSSLTCFLASLHVAHIFPLTLGTNIVNVIVELSSFGRPKKEKLEPHLRRLCEAIAPT